MLISYPVIDQLYLLYSKDIYNDILLLNNSNLRTQPNKRICTINKNDTVNIEHKCIDMFIYTINNTIYKHNPINKFLILNKAFVEIFRLRLSKEIPNLNLKDSVTIKDYFEEKRSVEEIVNIYVQLILNIQLFLDRYELVHNNLSLDNVLIKQLKEPVTIDFKLTNKTYQLTTKTLVIISNFDFAHLVFNGNHYGVGGFENSSIFNNITHRMKDIFNITTRLFVLLHVTNQINPLKAIIHKRIFNTGDEYKQVTNYIDKYDMFVPYYHTDFNPIDLLADLKEYNLKEIKHITSDRLQFEQFSLTNDEIQAITFNVKLCTTFFDINMYKSYLISTYSEFKIAYPENTCEYIGILKMYDQLKNLI